MPLPTGGGQWPPKALAPVTSQLTTWSAWYTGDPDQLSAIYGGNYTYGPGSAAGQFYGSESGKGVRATVGRVLRRWFWGTQTPSGEQQGKLHLPAAGDIASVSAGLLFSEPPKLKADEGDETTQDRLDTLAEVLHAGLLEAADVCSGLGGVYLRVVWDEDLRDHPWLTAVHADAAVPEFKYDVLTAVTFWRVVYEDGKTIRRWLQRHERGLILNGLYQGTRDDLGALIPLAADPSTRDLEAEVPTGTKRLTAAYIPNMRPARVWRDCYAAANLGRADCSGVEQLMDRLDEVWTSWMRDIDNGKGRLHVPATYLQSQGNGQGAIFESERQYYTPIQTLGKTLDAGLQIEATQFAIRVEEHARTALELYTRIVSSAGFSPATFGLMGDGAAVTATEVRARERRSYITRDHKALYWSSELPGLLEALLAIDAAVFKSGVTAQRPGIEFGDAVSEDPKQVAETIKLLHDAEAASTEVKVRMLHPDWDKPRVLTEVAAIHGQSGVAGADPIQRMTDAARGLYPQQVDPLAVPSPGNQP